MNNVFIIPSTFNHTQYALLTLGAAVCCPPPLPPIVYNFISEQIGHWNSPTGAE